MAFDNLSPAENKQEIALLNLIYSTSLSHVKGYTIRINTQKSRVHAETFHNQGQLTVTEEDVNFERYIAPEPRRC